MLTVRTSENTVITSFRLISERQDFSSVRTGENTVRARARIQYLFNQFKDISEMLRTKSTKFVYGYLAVGLLIVLVGVVVEQLAT